MRTKNGSAESALRNGEPATLNAGYGMRNRHAESAVESATNRAERFSPLRNPQKYEPAFRNNLHKSNNDIYYESCLNVEPYKVSLVHRR